MTLEECLAALEKKLDLFTEEEKKVILKKYREKFQEDFTHHHVDALYEEILHDHGINGEYIHQLSMKSGLKSFIIKIHDVIMQMSKNSWKENMKVFGDILILIILICLLKIPFIFVRNLGENLFTALSFPLGVTILYFAIEVIYIFVAIIVFVNIFSVWYEKKKESTKNSILDHKAPLEAVTLEKKE